MSRIDVVPGDEHKFKVLVNFVQNGVELSSRDLANQEAVALKKKHYPKAEMHLCKEAEIEA